MTQKGWSIHPNPTKGTVYLTTVNKNIQETSFTLYDITGRPIPVIFSSQNQYEVTVDLSTLSAGLFFLELLNEDGEKQVLPVLKE